MATVHRESGICFRVYPNDHGPAHVHAWIGRTYARIALPSNGEAARVVRIVGKMKAADVVNAVEIVQNRSELMWEGWNRFHGTEADTR